jgi:hypothetical protein
MKTAGFDLRLFIAGSALILAVNAIVLAGVAWNRSGEPDAVVRLSERELVLPYHSRGDRDNSGIALDMSWRVGVRTPALDDETLAEYRQYSRRADWLDADALRALGFDLRETRPGERARYSRHWLSRDVWLVLELAGDQHAWAIARAEARLAARQAEQAAAPDAPSLQPPLEHARRQLREERESSSRLFVVDVGRDPGALRETYPDRSRFLVVSGKVRPTAYGPQGREHEPFGVIEAINIDSFHVPARWRAIFEPLLERDSNTRHEARYEVELAYGKRREPWIVDAVMR